MSELKIFKEILIGGVTGEAIIRRLREANIQFNKYADILFEHRAFAPGLLPERAALVKVTLSDLRLEIPCSLQDIINRAAALGLRPCPLSLGAFLRLEYLEQPAGQYLTIASTPLETDENYPTGFYIRNFENTLWLRGYRVIGSAEWPADNEFIFLA